MNLCAISKFLLPFTLLMTMLSCGKQNIPEGVLGEDVMVDILYESYLFEGYSAITTDYNYRELSGETAAYYENLFERHNVTQEQFDTSVEFYLRNKHLYEEIYNRVVSRLDSASQVVLQ